MLKLTDVQVKLLNLVDEIADICEKKNLHYVVAGMTAGYVINHKKFDAEQCYFNINMPLKDIVVLEEYVKENLSDKRFIESWRNNQELSMLKFRYVDKNTLLFDGGSTEKHIANGIHVNIFPTREFEPSNEVRGCERYLQLESYGQSSYAPWVSVFKLATRVSHVRIFKRYIMGRIKLENANYIHKGMLKRRNMTKKEFADFIIDENLKANKPFTSPRFVPEERQKEGEKVTEPCLAYMTDRGRVVKFPIDLYSNVKKYEFEGRQLNVYSEYEKYFESLYQNGWENKITEEINGTDRSTVIYDAEIGYAEYGEYIKDDKVTLWDIADNKKAYNAWMGKYYNPAVNKAWHTFMRARRGVERIDVWYRLRDKREALREAYDSGDNAKLRKLMKGYLSTSDRYTAEKIGFYIDDELFKYATRLWEEEERPGRMRDENPITYAEYVYSLVPDLYKTETPDIYFENRGKTFD